MKVTGASMRVISLAAAITWSAILLAETQHGGTNVGAAAPPCNNYLSEVTPPENIGVAITNASGNVVGVSYVDFKSYVKDVLPNEWLPNWQMAAYQAGALAVKGYGWYYVTPGVVRLSGNAFIWYLRNAPGGGSADVTPFAYGQYGDIPVVGDWDGNGTWTPGVVRGNQWYMRNYNSAGGHNILASYGDGGDTPLPGKWKTQSANQPMTLGIVRFDPIGTLHFYQRFSNTSGTADRHFTYGNYTDRAIAGDWNGSDNSTHFGPGVVRDDASDYCRTPPMNQGWYLRYTNDPGVANMSFRYDVIRP